MSDSTPKLHDTWGPDIITVTTDHKIVLPARRANLHVNIRGTSYFSGNAALTKAREVGQLVGELKRFGLSESAIQLKAVNADVSSGSLGKTSSANYELKIHCAALDQMADIVGIVTSQKNTSLHGTEWEYDGEEAARADCLVKCVEKANARARLIAQTLGVRLVGVLYCVDSTSADGRIPMPSPQHGGGRMPMQYARAPATAEDFDTSFSHDKTIGECVTIAYRISELEPA